MDPLSLFVDRTRYSRFSKFPRLGGKFPEILFSYSRSSFRCNKFLKVLGMVPVSKSLLDTPICSRSDKLIPKIYGTVPLKLLLEKLRYWILCKFPSCDVKVPDKILSPSLKNSSSDKYPIFVDKVPVRLFSSSIVFFRLTKLYKLDGNDLDRLSPYIQSSSILTKFPIAPGIFFEEFKIF